MKKNAPFLKLALLAGSLALTALAIECGLRIVEGEAPAPFRTALGQEFVRRPFPGVPYVYPGMRATLDGGRAIPAATSIARRAG